ncbi:MAG: hypothetical protein ACREYF_28760, partial [Gammaproteobacteria bacterium]
ESATFRDLASSARQAGPSVGLAFIGPRRYVSGRFGVSGGHRPRGIVGSGVWTGREGVSVWDQAIWSRSNSRAGEPGIGAVLSRASQRRGGFADAWERKP